MRLWSVHPGALDAKGLVALWRETLLAQKVLVGTAKGYKNHPQLKRFREHPDPLAAVAYYLSEIRKEALRRGYKFDGSKILKKKNKVARIKLTGGQLKFEYRHLARKLKTRDPAHLKTLRKSKAKNSHPLFKLTSGDIADWEKH